MSTPVPTNHLKDYGVYSAQTLEIVFRFYGVKQIKTDQNSVIFINQYGDTAAVVPAGLFIVRVL